MVFIKNDISKEFGLNFDKMKKMNLIFVKCIKSF